MVQEYDNYCECACDKLGQGKAVLNGHACKADAAVFQHCLRFVGHSRRRKTIECDTIFAGGDWSARFVVQPSSQQSEQAVESPDEEVEEQRVSLLFYIADIQASAVGKCKGATLHMHWPSASAKPALLRYKTLRETTAEGVRRFFD